MKNNKHYPTKTSVNLVMKEKAGHPLRNLILFLVLAVLVAAFAKFAVIDVLAQSFRANNEASAEERKVASLREANADYGEVLLQYQRYFSDGLMQSAIGNADCMQVINLVEQHILPLADVQSLTFTGSVISLQLAGAELDTIANLMDELSTLELVKAVDIYTADAETVESTVFVEPDSGESEADAAGESASSAAPQPEIVSSQNTVTTMTITLNVDLPEGGEAE